MQRLTVTLRSRPNPKPIQHFKQTFVENLLVKRLTQNTSNREDDQEDDTLINASHVGTDENLMHASLDFDNFVHDLFENHQLLGVAFPSGSKSIFSYFVDLQVRFFCFSSKKIMSSF